MASKRSAAEAELATAQQELKKTRRAVNEAVNEFLCPITKQLMTEPVIASDGQTYDRAAIDEVTPAPAPPSTAPSTAPLATRHREWS